MERKNNEKWYGVGERRSVSKNIHTLSDAIREIVRYTSNNFNNGLSEENTLQYLKIWWSNHYNRPLKDPILEQYTLEELMYEYYSIIEYNSPSKNEENKDDQQDDKIEEEKRKENEEWAARMEEVEKMEESIKADPKKNNEWMNDQVQKDIEEGKQIYGEDYGEDLRFESEE